MSEEAFIEEVKQEEPEQEETSTVEKEPVPNPNASDDESRHQKRKLTAHEEEVARFDEVRNDITREQAEDIARAGVPAAPIDGQPPKPTAGFRFAEGFIAASHWPAAAAAALLIVIVCMLNWELYQALCLLPLALLTWAGRAIQKSQAKGFDMSSGREGAETLQIKRASRQLLGNASMSMLVMSVVETVVLVLLSIIPLVPVCVAWLASWVVTFLIGYSAAGKGVSSCAPYADTYDVELSDGTRCLVLSFDLVDDGDERALCKVPGEENVYIAIPKPETAAKQSASDSVYEIGDDGIYRKRVAETRA